MRSSGGPRHVGLLLLLLLSLTLLSLVVLDLGGHGLGELNGTAGNHLERSKARSSLLLVRHEVGLELFDLEDQLHVGGRRAAPEPTR